MLAAALTSCGNTDRGDGLNHLYNAPLLGNPASLDPQFASDDASATVIKNLYSGLVTEDAAGNISCCNAESYTVSADGTVYTFKLREDNFWFFDENGDDVIGEDECFPVKADDYVFAFRRLLDPKMKSPYSQYYTCIKGGTDSLAGIQTPESIGVRAIGDYSVEFTLEYPSAEFLGLLALPAASPCNKEFFESTKGRYGLDDRSVMSNGAFYVRTWFYDPYGVNNILYMRRNEANVNESYEVCPSYLSFFIEQNEEDIRALFKDETIDCFTTLSSSAYDGKHYAVTGVQGTTLGFVFNPADKYFANATLRQALALALDREAIASGSKDIAPAYGIVPPAVKILGRSYRELSSEQQFAQYDPETAKTLYEQAKTELGTQSIMDMKILVCGDTADAGYLRSVSQQWQETLGCYIGIDNVTEEEFYERIESGDYTIALYPLSGDFCDAAAVMNEFTKNDCLKNAAGGAEFLKDIMKCTTASGLVDTVTAAEQSIIGGYGFIPLFYRTSYLVAQKDNEEIYYDPFSGAVDFRSAKNYS
ncbi:MAG: peptide ABC transporter substrate-binding protein [Ruminococcus sp.]|nr:peptide ABC transporter substrate-binding protein [Ruminococcus sp.]